MEYPMNRTFLSVIAAGSIIWGMMAISAYAAAHKDTDSIDATHSVGHASPHLTKERITLFGIAIGREDGTQTSSPSEGKMFDEVLNNPNIVAKKGNFCNTESGGCPQIPEKKIGRICSCPDGSEGRVTSKRINPIIQAPTTANSKNEKDKKSDSTDSTINKALNNF
jgi:hypothetical protein